MGLSINEERVHWRTLDAPHAGYEDASADNNALRAFFPNHNTVCCGVEWGSVTERQAHTIGVHA